VNISKIKYLDLLIKTTESRLNKLFELIETTDIDLRKVSPRIKELSDNKEAAVKEKQTLEHKLEVDEYPKLTEEELSPYLEDLQNTLMLGSKAERKAFIRSFIKKITVDYPMVEIEYTIPFGSEKKCGKEVLVINKSGWPERIRTIKVMGLIIILTCPLSATAPNPCFPRAHTLPLFL